MKTYIFSLLAIIFAATVHSAPELKGNPDELKRFLYPDSTRVTITETAKEKAYSDKAIINLVIETEEDKMSDAIRKNTELRLKVSKLLTEAEISPDNIKTSKFSTSPQFGWFGDEPDSYQIINRMAVSIFREKHFYLLASFSDSYKEISLSTKEFEHTQKEKFEASVKKKALEKVMAQKAFYETQLGLVLKPVAFRDFDVVQSGTRSARDLETKIVVTGSRIKRSRAKSSSYAEEVQASVPQTFDEVEYKATISVEFEVLSNE